MVLFQALSQDSEHTTMSSASEPVSELTTEDDMSSAQEDTSTPNDSSPPRYAKVIFFQGGLQSLNDLIGHFLD